MSEFDIGTAVHPNSPFEADMARGYFDGCDPDSAEPGDNRSRSYRHGFLNGRDDLHGCPRALACDLRKWAAEAIAADSEGLP